LRARRHELVEPQRVNPVAHPNLTTKLQVGLAEAFPVSYLFHGLSRGAFAPGSLGAVAEGQDGNQLHLFGDSEKFLDRYLLGRVPNSGEAGADTLGPSHQFHLLDGSSGVQLGAGERSP